MTFNAYKYAIGRLLVAYAQKNLNRNAFSAIVGLLVLINHFFINLVPFDSLNFTLTKSHSHI